MSKQSKKVFSQFLAASFSKPGNYFKETDFWHYFEWDYLKFNCAKILKSDICWTKKKRERASLFDNKKGSKQRKTCIFLRSFPLIYFSNAQITQTLTATLVILAMWTYAWGVGSTSLHCLITKRAQNQAKRAILIFFRWFILLTLS